MSQYLSSLLIQIDLVIIKSFIFSSLYYFFSMLTNAEIGTLTAKGPGGMAKSFRSEAGIESEFWGFFRCGEKGGDHPRGVRSRGCGMEVEVSGWGVPSHPPALFGATQGVAGRTAGPRMALAPLNSQEGG